MKEYSMSEQAVKQRAKREYRAANNLCLKCGRLRDNPERKNCDSCRAKMPHYGKVYSYASIRERVLQHYGGQCVCCGETARPFLAIDHGPGAAKRKDNPGQNGALIHKWIVDNNFPKEFRILCHNCNMATRYGRTCPHQEAILQLKEYNTVRTNFA